MTIHTHPDGPFAAQRKAALKADFREFVTKIRRAECTTRDALRQHTEPEAARSRDT